MTIEEKRAAIEHWCESHSDEYCRDHECPLSEVVGSCYTSPLADIERNYDILFGKKADDAVDNPYWDRITKIANRQRSKGITEYGRGIEDDTADMIVRLDRIEEELIDALMYIEHLKDGISKIKEIIR